MWCIFIILNKPSHKTNDIKLYETSQVVKEGGNYFKGQYFQGGHQHYECNQLRHTRTQKPKLYCDKVHNLHL